MLRVRRQLSVVNHRSQRIDRINVLHHEVSHRHQLALLGRKIRNLCQTSGSEINDQLCFAGSIFLTHGVVNAFVEGHRVVSQFHGLDVTIGETRRVIHVGDLVGCKFLGLGNLGSDGVPDAVTNVFTLVLNRLGNHVFDGLILRVDVNVVFPRVLGVWVGQRQRDVEFTFHGFIAQRGGNFCDLVQTNSQAIEYGFAISSGRFGHGGAEVVAPGFNNFFCSQPAFVGGEVDIVNLLNLEHGVTEGLA